MNKITRTSKTPRRRHKTRSKSRSFVKTKKRHKFLKRIGLIMLAVGMIFFNASLLISVTLAQYLQNRIDEIPNPELVFEGLNLASEVYDSKGGLLYRMFADNSNSDKLTFDEVNNLTIAAFMAAEDAEFFNHDGVSLSAISRCAYKAISSSDLCGGSTITQQLVKIRTKKNQPTIERKLDEIFLANAIEQKYSKTEILELYLNTTPYGSNIVGLKTAAKFYFNLEDIAHLTLKQSVALAAIVNNPNQLTPTLSNEESFKQSLIDRMDYVYDQLVLKQDLINSQLDDLRPETKRRIEADKVVASQEDRTLSFSKANITIKSGHFVSYVVDELTTRPYKNGEPFTLEELQNGGYRIYTTLDPQLQKTAERYAEYGGNAYKGYNIYNAALMTIDPGSGKVLAMAGSKSFTADSEGCDSNGQNCKFNPEVNIMTSLQSPGSTNKPLGYYEAFRQGKLFPGSLLPDIEVKFGNYTPKNWDSRFWGPEQTASEMLQRSRNIPALGVMLLIGIDRYKELAAEFGYTSYQNADVGLSLILGGGDVYPVEHAGAFGVFANNGKKVNVDPINKIYDEDGNLIYEAKREGSQVADAAAVYQLNATLNHLNAGTGETVNWDNRDVAAKTGTTEDNKDNWLIMYSPDFVTVAWSGNNNNDQLNTQFGWPGLTVLPWAKGYMSDASSQGYFSSRTPFYRPPEVYWGGGDCVQGKCRGLQANWLIRGREPEYGDVVFGNRPVQQISTDKDGNEVVTTGSEGFRSLNFPIKEFQEALNRQ